MTVELFKRSLLFVLLSVVCLKVSHAVLVVSPSNTVTNTGRQVSISCSAAGSVLWQYYPVNSLSPCNAYQNGINPSCVDNNRYSVTPTGQQYNLVISNTLPRDAGVYVCMYQAGDEASAIFGVIESGPSIRSNVSSKCALQGSVIQLTCHGIYNGSGVMPLYLNWTDSAGQHVASTANITGTDYQSTITVTADRSDISPYTCTADFNAPYSNALSGVPGTPPAQDYKEPTYSNTTLSPGYTALYCPDTITISAPGNPNMEGEVNLPPGTTLTCSTSAGSAGTTTSYQWTDGLTGQTTYGSQVNISVDGAKYNFTCTATSVTAACDGVSKTCTLFKTVYGNATTTTTTVTTIAPTTTSGSTSTTPSNTSPVTGTQSSTSEVYVALVV